MTKREGESVSAKREEIREGLSDRIYGLAHQPPDIDEILSYLHSAGCVLKVEREWPEILAKCICETHPELAEIGEVGDGQYHACEDYRERVIESGFGAFEPLLEGAKNE